MGIMPVSSLLLSHRLLGEFFKGAHLGGFAIVFAGVVLIVRDDLESGEAKISVNTTFPPSHAQGKSQTQDE